jgi:hypothetical protein
VGSTPRKSTLSAPWSGRPSPYGIGPPVVRRAGKAPRRILLTRRRYEARGGPRPSPRQQLLEPPQVAPSSPRGPRRRPAPHRRQEGHAAYQLQRVTRRERLRPSSAARPPTATLRLSSDAGRRLHPTMAARLHHINILAIIRSFLSSPSDDTFGGHGVRLGSQIRPNPQRSCEEKVPTGSRDVVATEMRSRKLFGAPNNLTSEASPYNAGV